MRIGDERLRKGRSAGYHGPGPARLSRHPAELVLVDDGIGVRIIRKADGGSRPKAIREIPVQRAAHDKYPRLLPPPKADDRKGKK